MRKLGVIGLLAAASHSKLKLLVRTKLLFIFLLLAHASMYSMEDEELYSTSGETGQECEGSVIDAG